MNVEGVAYNVFVPAFRKGEVSEEQFKMQLRKGMAVRKGVVDTYQEAKEVGMKNWNDAFDIADPMLSFSDYANILGNYFKNFYRKIFKNEECRMIKIDKLENVRDIEL